MKIINCILIANRGEIASRIARTCKQMGIRSVAIFSDVDRYAPFVNDADTAIHIGESVPLASYLDQNKIIKYAKEIGADAIHPGYGFLAENAAFAKKCADENIIFIGPNPQAIANMGSKSKAKALMRKHDVPVIPGYQGSDQSADKLLAEAQKIGFPILLKAAAGGGGKGMRIVHEEKDVANAIASVKREALNAFGDDELIIEKYISAGRHIEFQIFGDQHGNTIHILERECTIQRRYQKIIEESPSPALDPLLRERMGTAAISAAKALQYDNAGTVEFILDTQTKDFYFLEVNTRLQVEHPVTEEITGLDLVKMQIQSAQGIELSISQENIKGKGYAIECRLYAEDPDNNFLPVTGTLYQFEAPKIEGLRLETAVKAGSEISIYYDPMIAKIIVWGENRMIAHRKMNYVLRELVCLGLKTNQQYLQRILEDDDFQSGLYDTHFVEKKADHLAPNNPLNEDKFAIAATLWDWKKRENARNILKALPSGWRNNSDDYQFQEYLVENRELLVRYRLHQTTFTFIIGEEKFVAKIIEVHVNYLRLEINGIQYKIHLSQVKDRFYMQNEQLGQLILQEKERFPQNLAEQVKGGYEAPMPSNIVKILVNEGEEIEKGDQLIVLSSMKMENTVEASEEGIVGEIFAKEGENVEAGFVLLTINSKP